MMNSVSSNDLSISATLLENENNNHLCNNNYLPLYIIFFSFLVSIIIFGIYYTFFM
jgi:hypothetical protein